MPPPGEAKIPQANRPLCTAKESYAIGSVREDLWQMAERCASSVLVAALASCCPDVPPVSPAQHEGSHSLCELYLIEGEVRPTTVIVMDGATGERICDVTVEGKGEGTTFPFHPEGPKEWGPPWTCSYVATIHRSGTYVITVSSQGYAPGGTQVELHWVGCSWSRTFSSSGSARWRATEQLRES